MRTDVLEADTVALVLVDAHLPVGVLVPPALLQRLQLTLVQQLQDPGRAKLSVKTVLH